MNDENEFAKINICHGMRKAYLDALSFAEKNPCYDEASKQKLISFLETKIYDCEKFIIEAYERIKEDETE